MRAGYAAAAAAPTKDKLDDTKATCCRGRAVLVLVLVLKYLFYIILIINRYKRLRSTQVFTFIQTDNHTYTVIFTLTIDHCNILPWIVNHCIVVIDLFGVVALLDQSYK